MKPQEAAPLRPVSEDHRHADYAPRSAVLSILRDAGVDETIVAQVSEVLPVPVELEPNDVREALEGAYAWAMDDMARHPDETELHHQRRAIIRKALTQAPRSCCADERDEGPQPVIQPCRTTCTGCKHLKTEWWKDYLENDETDSGTSARCGAMPDEHGGKSITAYWSDNSSSPSWCPFATAIRSNSHDG